LIALLIICTVVGVRADAALPSAAVSMGRVTCDASGTLSFSPPLSPNGTGGSRETVVLTEKLTKCKGQPGSRVPSSPHSVSTKPIELPPSQSPSGGQVVGSCRALGSQLPHASMRQTIRWGGNYQTQSFSFASRLLEAAGIYYFFEHSSGSHRLQLALGLASKSSNALQTCFQNKGGPIGRLVIDPVISSMTEGVTVLTTHKVGGTNAQVGDQLSAGVSGGPACTSAAAKLTVQFNPARPGVAMLLLTSVVFSGCSINMGPAVGDLLATVDVHGLSDAMSISDAPGDPAKMGGVSVTISVNSGSSTCVYASAASVSGGFQNGTDAIGFTGSLAYSGGTGSLSADCPSSSLAAISFSLVLDTNQVGSPAVFVNS
jgi:hypothetical protein